jgi:PAS domain S-box-containing protein
MFFDSAGKLTRAAGAILDITSRRHAEAALRESEERYRTLVETAPDAVNVQRDGVIIVANQQAAKLFGGRVPEDIVGRTAISLVDDASVEAARARTIRLSSTGQPNPPLEMTMRRLDGSTVEVEAASALIVLEGRPAIQAVLRDITERKRHERALRESETRFRLAAAAVQGIVYDVDLLTGAAWRSDGLERILGTAPDAVPGTASWWVERIHPEDVACIAEDSRLLADPGVSHLDREYRVRHARGHWVHLHDRSFVVRDKAGRALRLIGVATDISERKAAEAQQALLAREVDHRARNVLAVVQSLVRLTRAADPSEFKRAVEGRVTALARVHSLLAENRWRGTELRRIVEEELAGFRDAVAVEVTGPAVSLRAEAAQPVAMVLHELVTNAAKHGTLSTVSGQLRVSWRTNSDGWLQVCWDETGGPQILAVPEPVGFGSTLIEAMLGQQLGGHIRRVWRPQGLRCEFAIPPDRLAEPGG